jgi:hypothetical protein
MLKQRPWLALSVALVSQVQDYPSPVGQRDGGQRDVVSLWDFFRRDATVVESFPSGLLYNFPSDEVADKLVSRCGRCADDGSVCAG